MQITLPSGRKIGDGAPVFVIAEVGSNWRSLEDCLYSIRQAKLAGASAVKFQLYTHKSLYGFDGEVQGRLDPAWLPEMRYHADKVGIELMCSAFSPEELRVVDGVVNLHKIASAELTHVRLLEAARECGKPVILSTGASGRADIGNALNVLGHTGGGHIPPAGHFPTPTVLMYCVAAYPAKEIDLECIPALRSAFGTLCGYSDHSLDALEIPRRAVGMGACVVEKHFNALSTDSVATPDSPHSLSVDGFKRMVDSIRGKLETRLGPTREEQSMVTTHNRRIIATRRIEVGETFREGVNIGIYRSLKPEAKALSPWVIDSVNGKRARLSVDPGEGVGPGDLE